MGSSPDAHSTRPEDSRRGILGVGFGPQEAWLRRLMLLGVCLPILFIVVLQIIRPHLLDRWWPTSGDLIITIVTVIAALCFGIVMFGLIERGHRQVARRNKELQAVNDLLLLVAGDAGHGRARTAAIDKARELMGGIDAGLWPVDEGGDPRLEYPLVLTSLVRGTEVEMLWVARAATSEPFCPEDQRSLDTLAELTAIAQERDRGRDAEHDAAVATERLHISREMHDSLAQILAVSHLKLRAFATHAQVPASVQDQLTDLADACEDAYTDVRETIHGLREAGRSDRDVVETMHSYVEWWTRQTGAQAAFRVVGDPVLGPHEGPHVLRVMQEALSNVRKHSGATSVQVLLESVPAAESPCASNSVRLTVADDGRGFDVEATVPVAHYGLRSMEERADALGGRLRLRAGSNGGTVVEMLVPQRQERRGGESADVPTSSGASASSARTAYREVVV